MYKCIYVNMYICIYIWFCSTVANPRLLTDWLFPNSSNWVSSNWISWGPWHPYIYIYIYIYQYIFIQTVINIYISTQRHANTCVDTLHWKCNTPFPSNLLSGAAVDCKIACSDGSSGQIQKEKHILDWSWIIYIYIYIFICIYVYSDTRTHGGIICHIYSLDNMTRQQSEPLSPSGSDTISSLAKKFNGTFFIDTV